MMELGANFTPKGLVENKVWSAKFMDGNSRTFNYRMIKTTAIHIYERIIFHKQSATIVFRKRTNGLLIL